MSLLNMEKCTFDSLIKLVQELLQSSDSSIEYSSTRINFIFRAKTVSLEIQEQLDVLEQG